MYKGIYIAASGAVLKQSQLEVITQNIANANTAGYKRSTISFKDYLLPNDVVGSKPDGRAMSAFSAIKADLSNGTLIRTGNPLDVAIEGDGFIALEGERYTRRGELKKDRDGYLTTFNGAKVLGAGGPIQIPPDSLDLSIDAEGKVSVMQPGSTLPSELDTLKIMDFGPDANMTKTGNGDFIAGGEGMKSASVIKQGYREGSNVDAVIEMVRMIDSMREFESYQKIIQTFDDVTARVTNDMGRL